MDIAGYLDTISAYRCYLEKKNIARGSEDDPLCQFIKDTLNETKGDDVRYNWIQKFSLIILKN
jgi:hypothetical protein